MQPVKLRSASSCDWSRNGANSRGARAGGFELACRASKKDNAETQKTQMDRREDEANLRSLFTIGASQKVNFTEPKSEKSVRLVWISLKPWPGCKAETPPVSTMFSVNGGRYFAPTPKSSPMV